MESYLIHNRQNKQEGVHTVHMDKRIGHACSLTIIQLRWNENELFGPKKYAGYKRRTPSDRDTLYR